MGTFLAVLFIIFLVLMILGPMLRPFLEKWMMGKFEDRMRRMMGMPTRKQERKGRRQASTADREWASWFRQGGGSRRQPSPTGVDFLRMYAVDVEFTEIKGPRLETPSAEKDRSASGIREEQQVEDAEFEEIR